MARLLKSARVKLYAFANKMAKKEEGASAAEYAVLLALIAVVIVSAVTGLSNAIGGAMTSAASVISGS
jgi:Flp pilus assembly pilin Flp